MDCDDQDTFEVVLRKAAHADAFQAIEDLGISRWWIPGNHEGKPNGKYGFMGSIADLW